MKASEEGMSGTSISIPVTVQLPADLYASLVKIAERTGRDVPSVMTDMLSEGVKMRRIPGIAFADEWNRREAKVAGTGLGVWEVIEGYRNVDEDWERFKEAYHWLDEFQLRAALAYAEAYPEEIEEHLRENAYWTPERLWAKYPFMKPPWR